MLQYELIAGSAGLKLILKSICSKRSSHEGGAVCPKLSSKDYSSALDSLKALFNDLRGGPHKLSNIYGYLVDTKKHAFHPWMEEGAPRMSSCLIQDEAY